MALTIEDGSIVAGADSWATRTEFIAYASGLGVTVADDDVADQNLRKAANYIASLEGSLKGYTVDRDQPLPYPRYELVIDGWSWSYNEIPRQVLLAQMALALDYNNGVDPLNPAIELPVIRNRVEGVVEQEFANPGAAFKLSTTSTAQALLNSLLRAEGRLKLIRA